MLTPEEIFTFAKFVYDFQKRFYRLGESFIDGAFFLAFFDRTFMPRVKDIRQHYWHTDTPPLEYSMEALHIPFGTNQSIVPYRAFDWNDEKYQRFSSEVTTLQSDSGVPNFVEDTILYGVPSLFPHLKYYERIEIFSETAFFEIRIFSARKTGKQVGAFYKSGIDKNRIHVTGFPQSRGSADQRIECRVEQSAIPYLPCVVLRIHPPWPKSTVISTFYEAHVRSKSKWMKQLYCGRAVKQILTRGRQPANQGSLEQIRTWSIFTAEKKAGLPIRRAIRQFNEWFKEQAYSSFNPVNGMNVTQSAEVQYQKERKFLFQRLPFLEL
jgi:hypothetical protein